jgi:hypothetical protein
MCVIFANQQLAKINFEKLTIETLDFNTPFPMEYAFNFWRAHPLKGEELRDAFWKFMRLYFDRFRIKTGEIGKNSLLNDYPDYDYFGLSMRLHHSGSLLCFFLFLWYSSDLLGALNEDDLNTVVIVDGELEDFLEDFKNPIYCQNNDVFFDLEKFKPLERDSQHWYWRRVEDEFRDLLRLVLIITRVTFPINPITQEWYEALIPVLRECRDKCERPYLVCGELEEILRKDDTELLVRWIFNGWHDLERALGQSFYIPFHPSDLIQHHYRVSMLDLAFMYRAMSIIKYLVANDRTPRLLDLEIGIATGDYELIQFCVNNWRGIQTRGMKEALTAMNTGRLMIIAMQYNQPEIFDWLERHGTDPNEWVYKFSDRLKKLQGILKFRVGDDDNS